MAAEAEAAREARAKVIAAEGEQKASRALREASEVIGDSPAALQLRYLQVIYAINSFTYAPDIISKLILVFFCIRLLIKTFKKHLIFLYLNSKRVLEIYYV